MEELLLEGWEGCRGDVEGDDVDLDGEEGNGADAVADEGVLTISISI